MIGVVANEDEHAAVAEFFELFKTPWEFYRPGTHYDVLLCSNSPVPEHNAKLLLLYGARQQAFEQYRGVKAYAATGQNFVCFRRERLPIYGNCLLFDGARNEVLNYEG